MTRLSSFIAVLIRDLQRPSKDGVALIGTDKTQRAAAFGSLVMATIFGNGLILSTTFAARAEDGNCAGFQSLAGNPEVSLARINANSPQTYFVRNRSDSNDCPSATLKCRGRSYLVLGDRLILGRTNGPFVCADFSDAKGVARPGWLPASAVDREVTPPPTPADWFGEWNEIEATITLKPSSKPGAVSISGEATWGTLDPGRVKAGAIHMGSIEGVASPNGAGLSFAMGANRVTLPVDKGEEGDCKVWMRRVGPYLLVSDNNNCGGMNVSFWGVYKKSGTAPKEPDALASVAGGAPPASPLQQTAGVIAEPAASTTTPSATSWTYTYFSTPETHFVGSSPTSQQAKIWLLCQPKPRSTEFRIDPGVYDQNAKEGEKSVFSIEIQNASGSIRRFPLIAYNFGPDGGSQFYSRDFVSSPFLEALGQEGGVLRWRTAKGVEIASWRLTGTAAAREMVRKVCHF